METRLTQTQEELTIMFSKMNIDRLTAIMHMKEVEINRQQRQISMFGEINDADSDASWENYKIDASDNLILWDAMKSARDKIKS
jgi:hypothetical protein